MPLMNPELARRVWETRYRYVVGGAISKTVDLPETFDLASFRESPCCEVSSQANREEVRA